MRNTIVIGSLLAASCQDAHHVEILLGPDRETMSIGFQCVDSGMPPRLLAARGFDMDANRLSFNLVVDFIGLGGGVPGCRGEEIVTWCQNHSCRPEIVDARYCAPVVLEGVSLATATDVGARVGEIYTQLRAFGPVTSDGPDQAVIVRAVATVQPCADLATASGGAYPAFDVAQLVGCAYSCPVQLDEVTGEVALSLDSPFGNRCEAAVGICAGALAPSP